MDVPDQNGCCRHSFRRLHGVRLARYATFQRFVETKAAKDPNSFFVLIQRHRDAKQAKTLSETGKMKQALRIA
ncbi:hypothetical protein GOL24_31700 [Sinorhizobium medicae]|uniref:hypothetical protein n=1 Tax=Sinorhizobium medicae TaxID=110321 RepID=UPI0011B51768|nr:hypothetical protein [Sinorhizobium medicae]MDX1128710.1 hypothetical protein [Sinorhizobium medicae]MDX1232109.1 hypothetical protein [Sinorhizobium medicae]PLU58047.1 hypothetical protein BMJ24_17160 [Sinorhizobium medicae]